MPATSLTGKDTIKINGVILRNFGDGDTAKLTFPNELMTVKTGKNGNSIYAANASGLQCNLELRLLRGKDDDKFLLNLLSSQLNSGASFALLSGEFTKNIGDGNGNVTSDIYIMSGGVFASVPEVMENVDGDTNQALTLWKLKFTNAPRAIT